VGEFDATNQQAVKDGLKLVWFDCYGTTDDQRYIAVWWPNPEMLAGNCDGIGEDVTQIQQRFVTEAVFTTGGLSYIALFGGQGRPGVSADWYAPLLQITPPPKWSTADLFPQFGMSSFPAQTQAHRMPVIAPEALRSRPTGRMTPPTRALTQGVAGVLG
jgi:hypothetical protein